MKRHDDVGTRPYCSHFLRGNASPCRPVPPLSHKSKAFAGTLRSPYGIRGTWFNVFPLGISAHRVKRHACALDETSRFEIRGNR